MILRENGGKRKGKKARIESVPSFFHPSISKRLLPLRLYSLPLPPPFLPPLPFGGRRGCCFTLFDFFKIYPCRFLAKSLSGRNLRSGNNTLEAGREEEGGQRGRWVHSRHVLPPLLLHLTDCLLLLLLHFLYDHHSSDPVSDPRFISLLSRLLVVFRFMGSWNALIGADREKVGDEFSMMLAINGEK